jgi:hypothetical protein
MPAINEKHYSIPELAAQLGLDADTIRPFFETRPDVLKIHRPETRLKRSYTTLRIPESVAQQVYADLCRATTCRSRRRSR